MALPMAACRSVRFCASLMQNSERGTNRFSVHTHTPEKYSSPLLFFFHSAIGEVHLSGKDGMKATIT